jgi:hypothetical protein
LFDVRAALRFDAVSALLGYETDPQITPDPVELPELLSTPVINYELALVVDEEHRLAKRNWVTPQHLVDEVLITLSVSVERLEVQTRIILVAKDMAATVMARRATNVHDLRAPRSMLLGIMDHHQRSYREPRAHGSVALADQLPKLFCYCESVASLTVQSKPRDYDLRKMLSGWEHVPLELKREAAPCQRSPLASGQSRWLNRKAVMLRFFSNSGIFPAPSARPNPECKREPTQEYADQHRGTLQSSIPA